MSEDKKDFPPVVVKKSDPPKVNRSTVEEDKTALLTRAGEILLEYDNKESNVPLNHEYWDLMNRYRAL